MKDARIVFAETLSQTTQLLKKSIVVESEHKTMRQTPFKRGIMEFEDFNYDPFNEFILVRNKAKEGKIKERRVRDAEDAEDLVTEILSDEDIHIKEEKLGLTCKYNEDDLSGIITVPGTDRKVAILSEKSLGVLVNDDYSHKSV